MAEFAMPLLIFNLGGEMAYILEQRLHAQAIDSEKNRKVLQDIVGAMLSPNFVDELFKPQPLYSGTSVRGLFDRVAHSSIMKLSESSMDKLYDLMTMGFKYQLMSITSPLEVLDVTLNHLESLQTMVGAGPVLGRVDSAIERVKAVYGKMLLGQMNRVRQTLLHFLQDKRVKVSLFLQEGLQTQNGVMVLSRGGVLPLRAQKPGTVRYFDRSGAVVSTKEFAAPLSYEPRTASTPRTKLGLNLYVKKPAGPPAATATPLSPPMQPFQNFPILAAPAKKPEAPAVRSEMDLIYRLIAPAAPSTGDTISITNLFADQWLNTSAVEEPSVFTSDTVTIDASKSNQTSRAALSSLMSELTVESKSASDEDLLDLINE